MMTFMRSVWFAMRRRWLVWPLVISLCLQACANAPSTPRQITLAGIVVDAQRVARPDESGLVQITRNGTWLDARADAVLQEGDWISTGPNAYALIRYPSGSEIYMRPNTRGRIGSFSEMVGEVFAKVRGVFAVQTTFVKAGAEGTAYSVRASQGGDYSVIVFDGTVRLSSLANAWPSVGLGAGSMASGNPQLPPRAVGVSAEDLSRSHAWVDRMEKLLPAPRGSASNAGAVLAVAGLIAIIAASQGGSDDLRAPVGLVPEGTASQPARLRSCGSLTLTWSPVKGAKDYVVTITSLMPARTANAAAPVTRNTSTTSLALPGGLYGLYRWHVAASDGRRSSPPSADAHFYCPG